MKYEGYSQNGAPLWPAAALLAFILSLAIPSAALAEEDGELEGSVTIGAQMFNTDRVSAHFGKYNGVDDKGTFLVGELELGYSKDLFFAEIEAKNLGLSNRGVNIELGNLGGYELKLNYKQTPFLISSNSKTIFNGAGSNVLTLPAGYSPGQQTKDMVKALTAAARDIKLKTNRTTTSAELDIPLGAFALDVRYSSDKKKGEVPFMAVMGISGGSNRAADLPGPVDYTTNDMSVNVNWKSDAAFAQLSFAASAFENANEYVLWDNPFPTGIGSPAVNYAKQGKTSLPPSNTFQRYGLMVGLKELPLNSALTLSAGSATSKQDKTLMAYTINPATSVPVGLPRSSASAQIDFSDYAVKISSKPTDELGVKVEYINYTTKNKTPRNLWRYIPAETSNAQEPLSGTHSVYNMPVDYAKTDLKADVSYSLGDTNLRLGYLNEVVDRHYREVKKTKEDVISAGVDSKFGMGKVKINYSSSKRKIDGHFDEAAVFEEYRTPEYIATITPPSMQFDDHPLGRKFDIDTRNRTKTGASLVLWPSANVDLTVAYSAVEDKYGDSVFGLLSSKGQNTAVDLTFRPDKGISVFLFYSTDSIKSEQASRQYSGATSKLAQSQDATRNWTATHDDKTPTMGAGFTMTAMDDALDLSAYYSASDATTAIALTTGGGLGKILQMPDLKTKLTSIDVTAKYKVSEAMAVGLGYAYETFETKNWALNGVDPASKAIWDVITMVPIEPDFKASKAMVFIVYSLGKH